MQYGNIVHHRFPRSAQCTKLGYYSVYDTIPIYHRKSLPLNPQWKEIGARTLQAVLGCVLLFIPLEASMVHQAFGRLMLHPTPNLGHSCAM